MRALVVPVSLLLGMLLSAATAQADIGEKIILRCTHGESLAGFTQKDYNKALKELETSSEEYSDCASLIHQAQLAAAGSRRGSGGLSRAPRAGAEPLQIGDQVIRPGVVHADIASAFSSLPTPLLAILLFLFACAMALAGGVLQNRVRGRHDD